MKVRARLPISPIRAARCTRPARALAALALLAAALGPARANAEAPREPFRLSSALDLPERVTLEVDQRTRYEFIDNQVRAGSVGSDQLILLRTRLRLGARVTDWLAVHTELQDSRGYLADDDTPLSTGMINAVELLEARVQLDFEGRRQGAHHTLLLGRMTRDIGSRRFIARNGFRNTSNAFTGLWWQWLTPRALDVQAFFWLPIARRPNDRPSLVANRIQYDLVDPDYQLFGLFVAGDVPWGDRAEIWSYGLVERDVYDASTEGQTSRRKLGTIGVRLNRLPRPDRPHWEWESALQGGVSTTRALAHFAHFHHVEVGYTFDVAWTPELSLHWDYASGDRDPSDDRNGTFDTLYGGRRFDFGPTSLYGAFARSNVNTPGVRVEVQPGGRVGAYLDYRAVWLASKRDAWAPNDVFDASGGSGSFVGQQLEGRIRWRPLPGNLTLEVGYAHLFAGEFIDRAPNANRGDTNYVYTQLRLDI